MGRDTRYIVTNLEGGRGKHLYEKLYSACPPSRLAGKQRPTLFSDPPHSLSTDLAMNKVDRREEM